MVTVALCQCGCGRPLEEAGTRTLAECKRRMTAERRKRIRAETKGTGRRALVFSEARPARPVCKVCWNLSERRGRVCHGCGLPWAPERKLA